jgi:hypothetical protein
MMIFNQTEDERDKRDREMDESPSTQHPPCPHVLRREEDDDANVG